MALPDGVTELKPGEGEEGAVVSNVDDLSDDVLAGLVDGPIRATPTDELEEPDVPTLIEETEVADEPEKEPEPVAAEPEPEQAEEVQAPTADEIMRMRVEFLESQMNHWRQAHDKLAGEYGRLKREAMAGGTKHRTAQSDYIPGDDGDTSPDIVELRREIQELREAEKTRRMDAANRAVYEEGQAFSAKFPDVKNLQQELMGELQKRYSLVQEALETADPDRARQAVREAMFELYYAVKLAKAQQATQKAGRVEEVKKRKLAASVSGGGSRRAAPAKARTVEDLSDDQLKALIDA
jgi:hypothetical protein